MRRLLLATLVATAVLVSGCATAQVLPDGRILLLSATGNKLFDPASGTATVTGASSVARIGDASAVLPDGKVLVTGGYDSSTPLASSETWDPSTGTFSPIGRYERRRARSTPRPPSLMAGCSSSAVVSSTRRVAPSPRHPSRRPSCTTRRPARSRRPDRCPQGGCCTRRRCWPMARCSSRVAPAPPCRIPRWRCCTTRPRAPSLPRARWPRSG